MSARVLVPIGLAASILSLPCPAAGGKTGQVDVVWSSRQAADVTEAAKVETYTLGYGSCKKPALLVIELYRRDQAGAAIPHFCSRFSMKSSVDENADRRVGLTEAIGVFGIAGRRPGGCCRFAFSVCRPEQAVEYGGRHVFVGKRYVFSVKPSAADQLAGRFEFVVPPDIAPGQSVTLPVVLGEDTAAATTSARRVSGRIAGMSALDAERWCVVYGVPSRSGPKLSPFSCPIQPDGTFSLAVPRLGGSLAVVPAKRASGSCWIYVDSVTGSALNLPKDATYVALEEERVSVFVEIPPRYVTDVIREERGAHFCAISLHRGRVASVPIAVGKIYPDQWETFARERKIPISVLPGEYEVFFGRMGLPAGRKMGTLIIRRTDDGETVTFPE